MENQDLNIQREEERGATMIEYALMVALIAVVAITIVTQLGDNVTSTFSSMDSSLTEARN